VGPDQDSTRPAERQKHGPAARAGCHPRSAPRERLCLLKGCEQPFPPRRATQRYCSDGCRRAARRWSRWKAQQSYRATAAGKEKRNGQSRRYRERIRNRRPAAPEEAVAGAARVITKDFFSTTVATARAATRDSWRSGDRPSSVSVRARAGAPWSGSGNANGAGAAPSNRRGGSELRRAEISRTY
jgi:hypothetical protein